MNSKFTPTRTGVSRRTILIAGLASVPPLSTLLASCGGGGGGDSPSTPSTQSTPTLQITSVSSPTPTARTALYVSTKGLDASQPFTTTLTIGGFAVAAKQIRTQSDGTVVLAVPLIIDPATGLTTSGAMSVQLSQGTLKSNIVTVTVQDLPSSSSYGATPGQISRGYLNYLTIAIAQTINHYQAIAAFPKNTVNTKSFRATLQSQLLATMEMRDNIDVIVAGKQTQLSIGNTAAGTTFYFNKNSIEVMDRIIGLYLQVIGYLPSSVPEITAKPARQPAAGSTGQSLIEPVDKGAAGALIATLGAIASVAGITSGVISAVSPNSTTFDTVLAGAQVVVGFAGLATLGTTAGVYIGGAAALLGVVATVNDICTLQANNNPSALDYIKVVADGLGAAAGLASSIAAGAEVAAGIAQSLETAFGQPSAGTVALQGTAFVAGISSVVTAIEGLAPADQQNAASSPPTQVGTATGDAMVTNANGPLLSPLTGVSLTDPGTGQQFTTVTDPSGNYDITVPIGAPGINYSDFILSLFDPISQTQLSSSQNVNLSGLSPNSPVPLIPLSGTCIDTDAGAPDSDDGDCDQS